MMESSRSASFMSTGFLVLASSTLWPFCNIGVTTMKMIRRTSITSAIGVTLMSAVTSPLPPLDPIPIGLLPHSVLLDEVVDQLGRRIRHFDTERFNLIGEPVVCPHGGHGHEQTESRSNECFG